MDADSLDGIVEIRDDQINVVEIMRQIRENIRQRRRSGVLSEDDLESAQAFPDGEPNYNLEEASIWHDKIYVDDQLRPPRTPLDVVLSRLRRPLHELVRFYVNRMCDKQVLVNMHLIRAVGALADEVSHHKEHSEEVQRLREEIRLLREEVAEMRKRPERG